MEAQLINIDHNTQYEQYDNLNQTYSLKIKSSSLSNDIL